MKPFGVEYLLVMLVLAGTVTLFSCTDFIATADLQEEWEIVESEHIMLHYRGTGFSEEPSPTGDEALFILQNQDLYYRAISDSIRCTYSDKVLIYLYNRDEAATRIGAEFGGHSIPKLNTFYFSFFHHPREYVDKYGVEDPFLGAHELVHVITHQVLGYPGTKLMSEGYANWLDGRYARYHIGDIVVSYRDHEPDKLMTPAEMLELTDTPEEVYYPNVGIFKGFLVREYGVERINRLFNSPGEAFIGDFEFTCQEGWDEMSEKYGRYIEGLVSEK